MPLTASLQTIFFLTILPLLTSAQTCYAPDGSEATDQKACPGVNSTSPGPCCKSSGSWPGIDPCLSNGFCMSTTAGYLYQGGCTSKNWLGCKNECMSFYGADYAVITPCYTPQSENLYCCGFINDTRTRDCCSNREGYDFSENGAPTFLGPLNTTMLEDGSTSTTSASTSTTTTKDENGTEIQTIRETVTVTASASGTDVDLDTVERGTVVGVGVGLGVPLGIALGTIAWLWARLRKSEKARQEALLRNSSAVALGEGVAVAGWRSPGYVDSPGSEPAELKPSHVISEVSSERRPVEAPTERM